MTISIERLRDLLAYDPETGALTWRNTRGPARAGDLAGSRTPQGYQQITIEYQRFKAHRIAWALVHGKFPERIVDHINGNPADNRIANLRLASKSQNAANSKRSKANKSGHKGVHWHQGARKWRAMINLNKTSIHLGFFASPDAAAAAYKNAAHTLFGEFARIK